MWLTFFKIGVCVYEFINSYELFKNSEKNFQWSLLFFRDRNAVDCCTRECFPKTPGEMNFCDVFDLEIN
jgi:hypothetical protein